MRVRIRLRPIFFLFSQVEFMECQAVLICKPAMNALKCKTHGELHVISVVNFRHKLISSNCTPETSRTTQYLLHSTKWCNDDYCSIRLLIMIITQSKLITLCKYIYIIQIIFAKVQLIRSSTKVLLSLDNYFYSVQSPSSLAFQT